jgi:hypothetical protein
MKTMELLEHTTKQFEVSIARDKPEDTLKIAGVYQDNVTRDWAMRTCRRATLLTNTERVHDRWFDINSLSDHGILLDAVRAALVADVIVVSVHAAHELPLDLHVWFAAWLPRRPLRAGALTAFIGVAESPDFQLVRTVEYLQAVARKAQLNFIPQQRRRLAAAPAAPKDLIADPGTATTLALQELYGQHHDAYQHWGINE